MKTVHISGGIHLTPLLNVTEARLHDRDVRYVPDHLDGRVRFT